MTFIAHVGDTHIVERSGDAAASLADQVNMLQQVGSSASKAGAELLVHGGDVFDRTSTPAERLAAIDVFTFWASLFPVVVVRGNHDRPLDLAFLSRISTIHPIYVFERPDVISVGGVTVACLPWPRKAYLAEALDTTSGMELGEASAAGMRAILQGLQVQLSMSKEPTVLLGHIELGGSRLDNGQPVAGNCDVTMHEADLLGVGADVTCLSHIHLHQVLGEGRIVYAGAPRPTRFGEEAAKGWCLIDVQRGAPPVIEHRRSAYRELITVSASWYGEVVGSGGESLEQVNDFQVDDDGLDLDLDFPSGASMKLSYDVDESERRAAGARAEQVKEQWLERGAHSVKLDPQINTVHRVRSEAIQKAKTTTDRLHAYWGVRDAKPGRSKQILSKLNDLETTS